MGVNDKTGVLVYIKLCFDLRLTSPRLQRGFSGTGSQTRVANAVSNCPRCKRGQDK